MPLRHGVRHVDAAEVQTSYGARWDFGVDL
jgi:hypothetical protein